MLCWAEGTGAAAPVPVVYRLRRAMHGKASAETHSPDSEADERSNLRRLRLSAGALSIVAGLFHLWVAPSHLAEWWGYGLFFAVVATIQLTYGGLWLSIGLDANRLRQLTALGIVGHLALFVLYLVTRTSGIPLFGPNAGHVEGIGTVDIVSKAVEVVLTLVLVVASLGIDELERSEQAVTR
jgi:hypothetical protein